MNRFLKIITAAILAVVVFAIIALLINTYLLPQLPEPWRSSLLWLFGAAVLTIAILSCLAQLTGYSLKDLISQAESRPKINKKGIPFTQLQPVPKDNTMSKFASCFISYSSKDNDFAKRLHADLEAKGVPVWFAPQDLRIGDRIRTTIDKSIQSHEKLLIVLSEHSINSAWVESEVEAAFERERKTGKTVLFPIRLDEKVMDTGQAWAAEIRRTRHIGDFRKWEEQDSYNKAFERLLHDLEKSS